MNGSDHSRRSLGRLFGSGGGGGGGGLDMWGGFGVLPPVLGGGFGMGLGFVSIIIPPSLQTPASNGTITRRHLRSPQAPSPLPEPPSPKWHA